MLTCPVPAPLHSRPWPRLSPRRAAAKKQPKAAVEKAPKAEKAKPAAAASGASNAAAGAGAAAVAAPAAAGARTLAQLEALLVGKSYVGGFAASRADREAFDALCLPGAGDAPAPNVERWARHMRSFSAAERAAWA